MLQTPIFEEFCAIEEADIIVLTVPYHLNSSNWEIDSNTSKGPRRILEYSNNIETYSFFQNKELDKKIFAYEVDIFSGEGIIFDKVKSALTYLSKYEVPIVSLTGDHSTSFNSIMHFAERYKNLQILQFDAHADLRDEYITADTSFSVDSHASIIKKLVRNGIAPANIKQYGITSAIRDEVDFMYTHNTLLKDTDSLFSYFHEIKSKGLPLYITFDVDCLDIASTPTPEGRLLYRDILEIIQYLDKVNIDLVSFDITEFAPVSSQLNELSNITTIFRELLLLVME